MLFLGAVALNHGEDGQASDHRQPNRQRGGEQAEATPPPAPLRLLEGEARLDEGALKRIRRLGIAFRPCRGLGEPSPAVEQFLVAAQALPFARVRNQAAVDEQARTVLLYPSLQPRPAADQCLVRDLDPAFLGRRAARGQQSCLGEPLDHASHRLTLLRLRRQLGEPDTLADVAGLPFRKHQPQQDALGCRLLTWRQPLVDGFGTLGEGALHAARLVVGAQGEFAVGAALP